ncbi:hypothetical protein V8F20_002824 [Naviculisporaceae sp. PSN 640]
MSPNPSALKSFEWFLYNNHHPHSSLFMHRLRWDPFTSPELEKSVAVIEDVTDAHSAQTGYSASHPIADQPATDPPVSSIVVVPSDISLWEYHWLQKHLVDHARKDPSKGIWRRAKRTEYADDERGRILISCCNTQRPPTYKTGESPNLEVEVFATSRPYVTINDYLVTVNKYIQEHRADILAARGINSTPDGGPFPIEDPRRQLWFYPTCISHPCFFEETALYRAHDMDWESLADSARSEISKITINYLYNTFPPELPSREYFTNTYPVPATVPGGKPTTTTMVSRSELIKGSHRKAGEMHLHELLYGPPKPRKGLSDEEMVARIMRNIRYPDAPQPRFYSYTKEYCLTKEAMASRFGDGVTCPAWRLDLLRGIEG